MDKYVIVEEPVEKSKVNVGKTVLKSVVLSHFGLIGALATTKILNDNDLKNAKKITLLQASNFINASNSDWKLNAIYVEHPRRSNMLIPVKEYKDYILREMVADIANYIQDNIMISRLTIGMVSSFNNGLGATIPVHEINANAKIDCKVARDYVVNYIGSSKMNKNGDYVWIDKFPDVKSAVTHNVNEFEVIKETSIDLNINASISDTISGAISAEKKMKFYISYSQ